MSGPILKIEDLDVRYATSQALPFPSSPPTNPSLQHDGSPPNPSRGGPN